MWFLKTVRSFYVQDATRCFIHAYPTVLSRKGREQEKMNAMIRDEKILKKSVLGLFLEQMVGVQQ